MVFLFVFTTGYTSAKLPWCIVYKMLSNIMFVILGKSSVVMFQTAYYFFLKKDFKLFDVLLLFRFYFSAAKNEV